MIEVSNYLQSIEFVFYYKLLTNLITVFSCLGISFIILYIIKNRSDFQNSKINLFKLISFLFFVFSFNSFIDIIDQIYSQEELIIISRTILSAVSLSVLYSLIQNVYVLLNTPSQKMYDEVKEDIDHIMIDLQKTIPKALQENIEDVVDGLEINVQKHKN